MYDRSGDLRASPVKHEAPEPSSVHTRGRRHYVRNDFMGDEYREAIDEVKHELSQKALKQIEHN